jgi:broad specificity phosphatase PhoE
MDLMKLRLFSAECTPPSARTTLWDFVALLTVRFPWHLHRAGTRSSAMKPTLQLILVRHGETEWTELGLLHGRLDSPLSITGRRHAEQTAARLRGETFNALFTSPKGRAMQTAQMLGEAVGLAPTPLDGLREMDFGWSEGKPLPLFDPDGTGAWLFRPIARIALHLTAERPPHFAARIREAIATMQAQYPQGRLLVVTHWAVISMLVALLLDGDPHRWRAYGPWAACSITELHATDGTWRILRLNDHQHLQEERSI